MPYTDWNYTNPGWTNDNPPAINESNLNDIANALSKLNLTSEQLSQLGLTTANGLGDIVSKLVENISDVNTELDQTNTALSKKGTLCATQYTYMGNGSDTVSIDISSKPYSGYTPSIAFVSTSFTSTDFDMYCICIYGAKRYVLVGSINGINANLSFTQNTITMSNAGVMGINDQYRNYNVLVI